VDVLLWTGEKEEACRGRDTSEEQVVYALRQIEGGKKVSEACREMRVSPQAVYRWKGRYGGLGLNEVRELLQLREENRKLKGIVADLTLEKHILQEVAANGLLPKNRAFSYFLNSQHKPKQLNNHK
jgi:putative transposase